MTSNALFFKADKVIMSTQERMAKWVNDDGFFYKHLKRPHLDSTSTSADPLPDLAAEAKARTERKKKVLLKLKTKYQQKIHHWEHLPNTLKALQNRMQNQPSPMVLSDQTVSVLPENSSNSPFQDLTDTLFAQVLAHPSIITVFGCWIVDVVTCRIQNYN
ncbi:unnamed protein product [Lactuca saligna]|uniref:Uncharacterized protein n=1 Tax=Lactuca saligna TaxID=75948 RepID=A0AA35YDF6_LACSI|nr:unnamed protein product [Lactuca saligna]